MSNQTNQALTNTFSKGLIMDLDPIMVPNDVLTDCLNGTLITYNGNEFALQNDMGNYKFNRGRLKDDYVPVGLKEHANLLYIVSYNPIENRCEIGSFPSQKTIFETNQDEASSTVLKDFEFTKEYISNKTPDIEGNLSYDYNKLITQSKLCIYSVDDNFLLNPGDDFYWYENSGTRESRLWQILTPYILSKDKKLYSLKSMIESGSKTSITEDDYNKVTWEIPGWFCAQNSILSPIEFNCYLKNTRTTSFGETTDSLNADLKVQALFDNKDYTNTFLNNKNIEFKFLIQLEIDSVLIDVESEYGSIDSVSTWSPIEEVANGFKNINFEYKKDVSDLKLIITPYIKWVNSLSSLNIVLDQFRTEISLPTSSFKIEDIEVGNEVFKYYSDDFDFNLDFNLNIPSVQNNNIKIYYDLLVIPNSTTSVSSSNFFRILKKPKNMENLSFSGRNTIGIPFSLKNDEDIFAKSPYQDILNNTYLSFDKEDIYIFDISIYEVLGDKQEYVVDPNNKDYYIINPEYAKKIKDFKSFVITTEVIDDLYSEYDNFNSFGLSTWMDLLSTKIESKLILNNKETSFSTIIDNVLNESIFSYEVLDKNKSNVIIPLQYTKITSLQMNDNLWIDKWDEYTIDDGYVIEYGNSFSLQKEFKKLTFNTRYPLRQIKNGIVKVGRIWESWNNNFNYGDSIEDIEKAIYKIKDKNNNYEIVPEYIDIYANSNLNISKGAYISYKIIHDKSYLAYGQYKHPLLGVEILNIGGVLKKTYVSGSSEIISSERYNLSPGDTRNSLGSWFDGFYDAKETININDLEVVNKARGLFSPGNSRCGASDFIYPENIYHFGINNACSTAGLVTDDFTSRSDFNSEGGLAQTIAATARNNTTSFAKTMGFLFMMHSFNNTYYGSEYVDINGTKVFVSNWGSPPSGKPDVFSSWNDFASNQSEWGILTDLNLGRPGQDRWWLNCQILRLGITIPKLWVSPESNRYRPVLTMFGLDKYPGKEISTTLKAGYQLGKHIYKVSQLETITEKKNNINDQFLLNDNKLIKGALAQVNISNFTYPIGNNKSISLSDIGHIGGSMGIPNLILSYNNSYYTSILTSETFNRTLSTDEALIQEQKEIINIFIDDKIEDSIVFYSNLEFKSSGLYVGKIDHDLYDSDTIVEEQFNKFCSMVVDSENSNSINIKLKPNNSPSVYYGTRYNYNAGHYVGACESRRDWLGLIPEYSKKINIKDIAYMDMINEIISKDPTQSGLPLWKILDYETFKI